MQCIMLKNTNFNVGVMLWKINILISTCHYCYHKLF